MFIKLSLAIFVVLFSCCLNANTDIPILDREQEYELESNGNIRLDEKFRVAISAALKGWVSNPIKNNNRSSKISWVDLSEFVSEVDQVSVYINPTNRTVIGSGNRTGGVYFNEEKKVIINLSLFEALTRTSNRTSTSLVGSEMLLLHEYLGALGYPDENYEISSHLYMRSAHWDYGNSLIEATENRLINHLEQNARRLENVTFEREVEGGTSTGVGGGGDPASASIKMMLFAVLGRYENYYKAVLKTEENYFKLVDQLVKLKVEPAEEAQTYDQNQQQLYIDIKTTENGLVLIISTSAVFYLNQPQRFVEVGGQIVNYIINSAVLR